MSSEVMSLPASMMSCWNTCISCMAEEVEGSRVGRWISKVTCFMGVMVVHSVQVVLDLLGRGHPLAEVHHMWLTI